MLGLCYALLGLGDTNYSTFCGGPKKLEKALKARGASSFYPTAYADDGVDMEDTVERWIDGLFPALKSHFNSVQSDLSFARESEKMKANGEDCKKVVDHFTDLVSIESELTNSWNQLQISNENSSVSNVEADGNAEIQLETLEATFSKTLVFDDLALNSCPIKQFAALSNQALTLPPLIQSHLDLEFDELAEFDASLLPYQNGAPFSVASSDIVTAKIVSAIQLSKDNAVKRALEVKLLLDDPFHFNPGDSFAICCKNDEKEINWLIRRYICTSSFCI